MKFGKKGRGYWYEGEFFRDYWEFNGGGPGSLIVWYGATEPRALLGKLTTQLQKRKSRSENLSGTRMRPLSAEVDHPRVRATTHQGDAAWPKPIPQKEPRLAVERSALPRPEGRADNRIFAAGA